MEKEGAEEQMRLYRLNKQFLAEVERGADWVEVKYIIDEMREVARRIEYLQPAPVLSMNNYLFENKASESAQG